MFSAKKAFTKLTDILCNLIESVVEHLATKELDISVSGDQYRD